MKLRQWTPSLLLEPMPGKARHFRMRHMKGRALDANICNSLSHHPPQFHPPQGQNGGLGKTRCQTERRIEPVWALLPGDSIYWEERVSGENGSAMLWFHHVDYKLHRAAQKEEGVSPPVLFAFIKSVSVCMCISVHAWYWNVCSDAALMHA